MPTKYVRKGGLTAIWYWIWGHFSNAPVFKRHLHNLKTILKTENKKAHILQKYFLSYSSALHVLFLRAWLFPLYTFNITECCRICTTAKLVFLKKLSSLPDSPHFHCATFTTVLAGFEVEARTQRASRHDWFDFVRIKYLLNKWWGWVV